MNTEMFLTLLCLLAIHSCNSIAISKNDVTDMHLDKAEDIKGMLPTKRDKIVHLRSSTSSQAGTASVPGDDVHFLSTENYNDITDRQSMLHRAAGSCSSLNPEQDFVCTNAVIADSKLNHINKILNDLVKTLLPPLTVNVTSQEADGVCSMNMSQLTYDLRTAITAVCLLDNVTETNGVTGGCCHSDSHIREEFQQFVEFLQINLLQLLTKDYQMQIVEPICVEKNVNVIWLVSQITNTLQKVKQLITAIESRQCQFLS